MRIFLSRQFLAFVITGGMAAAVNFASRILYSQWMSYSAAIVVAYVTGMITAFLLARTFVFTGSRQSMHSSAMLFGLVNLLAVVQVWAISIGLASYVLPAIGVQHYVEEIAHAIGVAFPVFTSYLGHKHWSFR